MISPGVIYMLEKIKEMMTTTKQSSDKGVKISTPTKKALGMAAATGALQVFLGSTSHFWWLTVFLMVMGAWSSISLFGTAYHTGAADAWAEASRKLTEELDSLGTAIPLGGRVH